MFSTTDRFQDGFLENVQATRLQSDANGLLVLVVIQAPLEHFIYDSLQAGINGLLLLILWQLSVLHTQFGVVVNAFS